MKWYVLHVFSGQELKIKEQILSSVGRAGMEASFGDMLVPTQEVTSITNGKKVNREKKIFPGYILINMDMNKETKHLILDTPGATHFIGVNQPQALRKEEVDKLMGSVESVEMGIVQKQTYSKFSEGEAVKIKDGPFKNFDGVVEEVHNEKLKLKVFVSVFGRSTPVELDFYQVESISK